MKNLFWLLAFLVVGVYFPAFSQVEKAGSDNKQEKLGNNRPTNVTGWVTSQPDSIIYFYGHIKSKSDRRKFNPSELKKSKLDSSRLTVVQYYRNGIKDGPVYYYDDTALVAKGIYRNGLEEGLFIEYSYPLLEHESGTKHSIRYVNGKRNGVAQLFIGGKLTWEEVFVNDKQEGPRIAYNIREDGTIYIQSTLIYENNKVKDGKYYIYWDSYRSGLEPAFYQVYRKGEIVKSKDLRLD